MEIEMIFHMMRHRGILYHFIYGEKGFHLAAHLHGRFGHRLVATLHQPPEHYKWLYKDSSLLRSLDHAIVMSRRQLDFVENLVGRGKVTFIPYGIDTRYFAPGVQSDITENDIRIIYAGSHLRDVEAMRSCILALLDALPNVTFDIVSQDPKFNSPEIDTDRVHIHTLLDDKSYLTLLQRADILLLPLRESTACTTVLEAMACCTPVITTEGGIVDYLDEKYAVVCQRGNVYQLVRACVDLAQNRNKRFSMSLAARKAAETTYSWPVIARQHSKLYESLYVRQ